MLVLVITIILVVALVGLGLVALQADDWTTLPTRYHENAFLVLWGLAVLVGLIGLIQGIRS